LAYIQTYIDTVTDPDIRLGATSCGGSRHSAWGPI